MPNCHVFSQDTSFQNQRFCRQRLICKVYLNLKGLAPNRTYIDYIENLCAIYFSRAICNFSPKFGHSYVENCHPPISCLSQKSWLLAVSCWILSFFIVFFVKFHACLAVFLVASCEKVTVSREKSKVHVTAEARTSGVAEVGEMDFLPKTSALVLPFLKLPKQWKNGPFEDIFSVTTSLLNACIPGTSPSKNHAIRRPNRPIWVHWTWGDSISLKLTALPPVRWRLEDEFLFWGPASFLERLLLGSWGYQYMTSKNVEGTSWSYPKVLISTSSESSQILACSSTLFG